MWALGNELGPSVSKSHACSNHVVISPALHEHLLTRGVNKQTQSCILPTLGDLMLGNRETLSYTVMSKILMGDTNMLYVPLLNSYKSLW